ncbi:fungal fruit body lectin-domain-containing protein [Lactarius hengduanensis]|nr:fungal fruit body lectin-domain-containing protein [Lactarius hengduanensis]
MSSRRPCGTLLWWDLERGRWMRHTQDERQRNVRRPSPPVQQGQGRGQQGGKGEGCIITLGVHSDKRWGDIIANLKNDQTACVINPQYYSKDHPNMEKQRERQLTSYQTTDLQGHKFSFEYVVSEGRDLTVHVIIA